MSEEVGERGVMHERASSLKGILVSLFAAMVYGVYPPMARLVYADSGNESLVILATTFARAIFFLGFCFFSGKRIFRDSKNLSLAVIGGFFQAVSIFGIFFAMKYLPGAVVIVLVFTHTLMLMFFLAWKRELTIHRYTLFSTLSALFGLSLVLNVWGKVGNLSVFGVVLGVVAAVATMSRLYAYQSQTKDTHPAVVGAENFLFAALFVLPIVFYDFPRLPVHAVSNIFLLYACLSLGAGTFALFYGISLLGSFRFSLVIKLEPLFTTIFGVWFAGEHLFESQYAGIGILIASLLAFQLCDSRQPRPARSNPILKASDSC